MLGAREREPGAPRELLALLAADEATTALRPAPLSAAAVATLLHGQFGAAPDESFVVACVAATGGNPFLCVELIRTLEANGIRPTAENVARMSGYVPPGISRTVLARLARLTPAARRAAGALAVLGGEADWNVLAELAELERSELAEAFDLLGDAGVVAAGHAPAFQHSIIRMAIYEDLPTSQRDRAHRRAAQLLAAAPGADREDVAGHLILTRPGAEPWVAERLGEAGDRALAQGAAGAACRYLQRAVAEPPAADQAGALLARLAEAQSRLGDQTAAAASARAGLEATQDPVLRGALAIALSLALVRTGRSREAMTVLVDALDALPDSEAQLGRRLEAELEVIAHLSGPAGRTVRGRALRFPRTDESAPQDHSERLALASRADVEMNRGSAAEAGRLALRALDDGALMRDEGAAVVLFFPTAIILLYSDHLDEAEHAYTEALGYGRETGLPGMVATAEGFLAGVAYRRGSLREAKELARSSLSGVSVTTAPLRAIFATAFLINALVDRGELGQAARALEEFDAAGPLPDALITNIVQHARGRLRSVTGDHEAALADQLDCGRPAAEWQMDTPAVDNWRSLAAIELAALERADDAAAHAAGGTRAARAFGSPRALGAALTIEGTISGEPELLEEAVAVLDGSPALLTRARALVALGSAQRRAGQRARARETLTGGLRLARVSGAVPLAREADIELRVLGSRSRRSVRSGVDELTVSERRVAELAADGYSNQQIAEALVISIRTVEAHLARTYQKLDISGRREIAAALGRASADGHPAQARAPKG